jgi:homopolymeric O-antigen transport system ATP-binding protein
LIELRGVSKIFRIPHERRRTVLGHLASLGRHSYEIFHALRDVSLDVGDGEFVGLLGPNGCGKSTLLRIVAGIYPPSAGRVKVGGEVAPVLDLGVGFHGGLPVRDNVLLYGVLLGLSRRRLEAEMPDILARAGVERFEDARLETLSTGLRMRLAFVLAMRAEAPLLLLDEALAVGDAAFARSCRAELLRFRSEGRSALLVSHDETTLEELCDRIVLLEAGTVVAEGPSRAMVERYRAR